MNIAFITHYCTHYRVKTYETLAKYEAVSYYFYSMGEEWNWDLAHGVSRGNFTHEYLPGLRIGRLRIPYTLPWKLWHGNYDLYLKCSNGKLALPLAYLIARLRGKPFVLWSGIWKDLQSPIHRLTRPLAKYIAVHADAIVAYGTHVKQYLVEQGVDAEKIFPSHHAVHNEDYNQVIPEEAVQALRRSLDLTPDQKVVLFVGRFVEMKGLPYLLEAFTRIDVPEAVLVFVGQGSGEAALRQQVEDLNLTHRVRFAGYVLPGETMPYYAMAWVHVLPSIATARGLETWGLVVNEAFNQGVPSIASTGAGAAAGGLIEDGVTGFVVPERDATLLADRLERILSDDDLRQKLSAAAREKIAPWDNEAMVADFRAAIHYALERHGKKKGVRRLTPCRSRRGNDI